MASNIYRIIDEADIIELLKKYPTKIILAVFATKNNNSRAIKLCLRELSKQYVHAFFLYIDVAQYTHHGILEIHGLPSFNIYLNEQSIIWAEGDIVNNIKKCFAMMETRNPTLTKALHGLLQSPAQQPIQQIPQQPPIQQEPLQQPIINKDNYVENNYEYNDEEIKNNDTHKKVKKCKKNETISKIVDKLSKIKDQKKKTEDLINE